MLMKQQIILCNNSCDHPWYILCWLSKLFTGWLLGALVIHQNHLGPNSENTCPDPDLNEYKGQQSALADHNNLD